MTIRVPLDTDSQASRYSLFFKLQNTVFETLTKNLYGATHLPG